MNRKKVIANLSAEVNRLMNQNIRLEEERAEIWRRNRDTEASRDTKAAIIAELKAENESLRKDARLLNILVEAMAEVKATPDGESDQPIADIVSGCLAEIAAISSPENPSQ